MSQRCIEMSALEFLFQLIAEGQQWESRLELAGQRQVGKVLDRVSIGNAHLA